ncbi:MAG: AIR synthase-related protein [Desulfonatronovibrionaceae bacterium]
MAFRIEVGLRPGVRDVRGEKITRTVQRDLQIPVQKVQLIKVYTVAGIDAFAAEEIISSQALHDPVLSLASASPLARDFDWAVEVGFKPGVTDNEGRTAFAALRMLSQFSEESCPDLAVYTSEQFLLKGSLREQDVRRIAGDLLANELIHRFEYKESEEWRRTGGFSVVEPRVTGRAVSEVQGVPLEGLSDAQLLDLSRSKVLALSLPEMRRIREHFSLPRIREMRRARGLSFDPTDAELECLAQTWSEHCKHKIFNARIHYLDGDTGRKLEIDSIFDTYLAASTADIRRNKAKSDFCRSVFKDNAGVITFSPELDVCIKVETHNSPSALDPYGGALTGIVGVNRDPMGTGLGANLLCNTDVFCFASPFYDKPLPPRLLHPRRVMEGVREGVEHGGNKSGIPTVNGAVVFDSRYLGKPLVFCGTVGTIPTRINGRPGFEKKASSGDKIVMAGGRIGKDGIHGATFSSEELHEGSPATAVQIGDPITQRKMYDFIIRARDLGLYSAITDNGAGGLSSSVGEMAEDCGGCEMDLARAPLKYDGLRPWEILLSEAQERMTLAVPEKHIQEFLSLAREMDVEVSILGTFTNSGVFSVTYAGEPVACLEMEFLHHGVPQMELEAEWKAPMRKPLTAVPEKAVFEREATLAAMLSRLNICSREYIIRQYDHEVQGGSTIKPLVGRDRDGPGDAAVLRPDLNSSRALVVGCGICSKYSDLDTYWMMANCIDEAVRNCVAAGGDVDYMAGVDNFCWCDPVQSEKTPDGRFKLAQLVRAGRALAHFCRGYGVPCVSGKDSMKNDYTGGGTKISIPPTVLFTVMGVIPDAEKTLSSDFKQIGEVIYVLGVTRDELGGSEFASEFGLKCAGVPHVDLVSARLRYRTFYRAVSRGLVTAAHDASDGGLGVALAEMAIGGRIGARIDLEAVPESGCTDPDRILYSESASRIIACVHPENIAEFEALFVGQPFAAIGKTTPRASGLEFGWAGEALFKADIQELVRAWKTPLDF